MREILFRGRRKDNGEWVHGYYVCLHDDKSHKSHRIYPGHAESDCGDFYPDWFEIDPNTIGQYIGLKDKHGEYIFEGDTLRVTYTSGKYDFDTRVFSEALTTEVGAIRITPLGLIVDTVEEAIYMWEILPDPWACLEVIGNIHDDPELEEGDDHDDSA
ncbi:MAG: hypothetical protein IJ484_04785 [Oscillospiraceae bacterium]|nr:hypothetical protein [Oscillospiraceae bacterium]